jgi:hypothetical protein
MRNLFRLQLGVATGHDDERPRVLFADPADCLAAFLVGKLCHRASVDDANISLFTRTCFAYALFGKYFPYGRSFGEIQLAS